MRLKNAFAACLMCAAFLLVLPAYAQDTIRKENWNFHFQQTVVAQNHLPFHAPYAGANSMDSKESYATSVTSTVFYAHRLWKGASFFFNPEFAGGAGLSRATGLAGFPNGETFRVGNPKPQLYVARLYLQQYFDLGKGKIAQDNDFNQLAGTVPAKFFYVAAGRFSLADFFDNNSYNHDPRTQFLNWSLMSNGAWDYPANTRGYTYGFVAAYGNQSWELRFSSAVMPKEANGSVMDFNLSRSHSETAELSRYYHIGKRKGALRALVFYTHAHMGNYKLAAQDTAPDITATRAYGRTKGGFGLNMEQELSNSIGMFARLSWNDGINETWAFTEIDRSASIGSVFNGRMWKRQNDELGLAFVANGISKDHQAYLAAGGHGFMVGDGRLNYAPELIAELYYSIGLKGTHLWLTPDYQFAMNPAYNKDRGPIHIFALRAHVEF